MTIPQQFSSLYLGQEVFVWSDCLLDLAHTSSLVTWPLYEIRNILRYHLISMAGILLWSSVVRVHDSQACRKMDVTRERISHVLELRGVLLSFQTGFSLVNAAVVCAIQESISCLEPSSVISESKYLKLVTVSSFCPFTSREKVLVI